MVLKGGKEDEIGIFCVLREELEKLEVLVVKTTYFVLI
jgi:hypothetical protein